MFFLAVSYMDGVYVSLSYFSVPPYPYIIYFALSFDFLIGPMLYFYYLSLIPMTGLNTKIFGKTWIINRESLFDFRQLLHFVPFLLHILFLLVNLRQGELSPCGVFYSVTASSLHISIYMVLALFLLSCFRRGLKEFYSDDTPYSFAWLIIVASGLFFVGMLRFISNIVWFYYPECSFYNHFDLKIYDEIGVFIFACALVLYALRKPKIFHLNAIPAFEKTTGKIGRKYETSALDEAAGKEAQCSIERYMSESKDYLEPDFNLASLADAVEMPAHKVSQVLNMYVGKNFFDFVNAYRIEECKRLLRDGITTKTITEIMYAVGFRSKSVFNTAFKRSVGQTPSQYRKQPTPI